MAKYCEFNKDHLLQKMLNSGALINPAEYSSPMLLLTKGTQFAPPLGLSEPPWSSFYPHTSGHSQL